MKQIKVSIESAGLRLAGMLRVPEGPQGKPLPAIVVGHPAAGVKEQTAALYASRLTEAGFVTLTFDTATQGESEGQPRGVEDPARRVREFKDAVSFLLTQSIASVASVGVLGICASGGYCMPAAATDPRIRAVAAVSPVDIGTQFRVGADGQQDPAILQALLSQAAVARTAAAFGLAQGTLPLFPPDEETALQGGAHLHEGWAYYSTTRGQHPNAARAFAWQSVDAIAWFDAFRFVDLIAPRPLLMIVGDKAVTRWMAEEAIARALPPKELFVIDGASHVALYDEPAALAPAAARLIDFFRLALGTDQGDAHAQH
ncbi:alpha/beta hydrolase [Paucibacter sp. R3-3]|uniref:Alpha/beta hydrolase n=1 Tax=Roseateles agri TaxID=3098619 RepID=A0ABU5DKQ8_9BURK|nr:alpha/beta hydrolase [Paucibacter sp. R3-3]MDY0746888.1 alpha/beta hydrolase [Paucibacter sp. R3-3]